MGGGLRGLVERIREVVGPAEAAASDTELLRRWATSADHTAFEVLVWRHARLVLGVCRRLLRAEQDVEDAFQATFLALARQALSVSGRAAGPWLYTVARRTALQLRGSVREATRDLRSLEIAEARSPDSDAAELRAVLDEEVSRLPVRYREPFVLCHLEGRSNEEAARELGRPVGTVHSRLARARALLRARLARRGLAPDAELPAADGAEPPGRIVSGAVSAATSGATAAVEALTKGVLKVMFLTKLKGMVAVLAVAVCAAGAGLVGYEAVASAPRGAEAAAVRADHDPAPPPARQPDRESAAPPSRQADVKGTTRGEEESNPDPEPKRRQRTKPTSGTGMRGVPALPVGGGGGRMGGGGGAPVPAPPPLPPRAVPPKKP